MYFKILLCSNVVICNAGYINPCESLLCIVSDVPKLPRMVRPTLFLRRESVDMCTSNWIVCNSHYEQKTKLFCSYDAIIFIIYNNDKTTWQIMLMTSVEPCSGLLIIITNITKFSGLELCDLKWPLTLTKTIRTIYLLWPTYNPSMVTIQCLILIRDPNYKFFYKVSAFNLKWHLTPTWY